MKVSVDNNSGFCWGVVRTVDIAEQELAETGKLYSLGEIIHNPVEIDRLEKSQIEGRLYTEYRELFQWWLLPGVALIVIELGLRLTRFRSLP